MCMSEHSLDENTWNSVISKKATFCLVIQMLFYVNSGGETMHTECTQCYGFNVLLLYAHVIPFPILVT